VTQFLPPLPSSWRSLQPEIEAPYFRALSAFLESELQSHTIQPPLFEVFRALELTPPQSVRVLLLGQDPYPGEGQANGLCFSVHPGRKPPASLRNIFRELQSDVGCAVPTHGWLEAWAQRGVLLLNAVLTVRLAAPNSHCNHGWETFTDAVIMHVNASRTPVVFALWGAYARKKSRLIDTTRHAIVTAAHPSPLSAYRGFFGSRPFSRINDSLRERGQPPIDWALPAVPLGVADRAPGAADRLLTKRGPAQ
jgi:uracil-DNA glycosylase